MSKQKSLCKQKSKTSQKDQGEAPSPTQMEEMYAKFQAWKDKYQENIIDMGGKLGGGAVVSSSGATDGPFAEAKEIVGGYMIITADSLEVAIAVAQESPGVFPGASVEVREIQTS